MAELASLATGLRLRTYDFIQLQVVRGLATHDGAHLSIVGECRSMDGFWWWWWWWGGGGVVSVV